LVLLNWPRPAYGQCIHRAAAVQAVAHLGIVVGEDIGMKRIGLFLISILFSSTAMAASGTINIQTTPAGAKYLIISTDNTKIVQDTKIMTEGISPYYDTAFPTGKYKVCFQLDGYVTVWQDIIVQSSGSAWAGPVMEKSNEAPQATCADAIAGMKAEQEKINSSLANHSYSMESIAPPTGTFSNAPSAVAPGVNNQPIIVIEAPATEDLTCREMLRAYRDAPSGSRERTLLHEKYQRLCTPGRGYQAPR